MISQVGMNNRRGPLMLLRRPKRPIYAYIQRTPAAPQRLDVVYPYGIGGKLYDLLSFKKNILLLFYLAAANHQSAALTLNQSVSLVHIKMHRGLRN